MTFRVGDIHPNTPHLLADLAELLLLIGYFGRPSLHKNDIEAILRDGGVTPEELDEESEAQQEADRLQLSSAEKGDRLERQLEDVLIQFNYRSKALEKYYPFVVEDEQIQLKAETTNEQRIYRLLLSCSRLRSFRIKGAPQKWAASFTKLCAIAMTALLPPAASARIFDANSDDRRDYYSTNLRDALRKLGSDLGVLSCVDKEIDNCSTSGDAGIDLVGTLSFDDGAAVHYAILGQCGAQETNWPSKRLEAHSISLRSYFTVQFDYPSVMFTPVCYRNSTGEWVDNKHTNGVLVVDRGRILNLLDANSSWDEIVSTEWFNQFEAEFTAIQEKRAA